jgi:CRISP-associated protein Cas1
MIKRTLYFGNPAYLKTRTEQMVVEVPETGETKTIPIEDMGLLILDHPQITITQGLMAKLLAHNVALINCNETHHPVGLLLNLDGNSLQSQKFQAQVEASLPLKKQLWQQTVSAKIFNQAKVLKLQDKEANLLTNLSRTVNSGDSGNNEAKAAVYYWKNLFGDIEGFRRDRYGFPPNNLLNYGYAILRALVARSLVGSGLLPTLGIFHRNQYNAYCLADDIMEPYRPFVDQTVCQIMMENEEWWEIDTEKKKRLLSIPAMDVMIDDQKSPLLNAVQRTTASLARCFEGKVRKISYAQIP